MKIEGKLGLNRRQIGKIYEIAGKILQEDFSKVCVSVNFVSEDEIQKLNNEFRKIDKVTDVLSFPNLNKKANQKLNEFENMADFDTNLLFLGDIIICKNVARRQAKEYGHSFRREVSFLALHGLLHLLGYDHIEKEEEKVMTSLSEKILQEAGVAR